MLKSSDYKIPTKEEKLISLLGQTIIIDGELKQFGNFRISGTLDRKESDNKVFFVRTSQPYSEKIQWENVQYSYIVFKVEDCSEIRVWNNTPNIIIK